MRPSALFSDILLLIARIVIGGLLIVHGLQKFTEWGLDGTAAAFEGMGVPAPAFAAFLAATIEVVGGLLLIIGLFTPVVGIVVALEMLGAWYFAHRGLGLIEAGGPEIVLLTAGGALAIAAATGRFSLDQVLAARRSGARQ